MRNLRRNRSTLVVFDDEVREVPMTPRLALRLAQMAKVTVVQSDDSGTYVNVCERQPKE